MNFTPLADKVNVTDFNKSLAQNGYQKLPSGLIIQWGVVMGASNGATITYPISFTSACYAAIVMPKSVLTNCQTNYYGASSFNVYMGQTCDIAWVAIGK